MRRVLFFTAWGLVVCALLLGWWASARWVAWAEYGRYAAVARDGCLRFMVLQKEPHARWLVRGSPDHYGWDRSRSTRVGWVMPWIVPQEVNLRLQGGGRQAVLMYRARFPFWFLIAAVLVPLPLWIWRRQLFGFGRCQACGYDLTGNTSGRCPECGGVAAGASGETP